jgi:hypothetical protein
MRPGDVGICQWGGAPELQCVSSLTFGRSRAGEHSKHHGVNLQSRPGDRDAVVGRDQPGAEGGAQLAQAPAQFAARIGGIFP